MANYYGSLADLNDLLTRSREPAGIQALLNRNRDVDIDLLATARGQQMAKDVAWQDRIRALQDLRYQDWENQREQTMQAQNYMASMANNYHRALQAGESPSQYLSNQWDQVFADPTFQSLDPRVQQIISSQLMNQAKIRASNLVKAGLYKEAQALSDKFGLVTFNPAVAQAQLGNVEGTIDALRQAGADIYMHRDPLTGQLLYIQNGQTGALQDPNTFMNEYVRSPVFALNQKLAMAEKQNTDMINTLTRLGIKVDSNGNLVTSGQGNSGVQPITAEGAVVKALNKNTAGQTPTPFNTPNTPQLTEQQQRLKNLQDEYAKVGAMINAQSKITPNFNFANVPILSGLAGPNDAQNISTLANLRDRAQQIQADINAINNADTAQAQTNMQNQIAEYLKSVGR